METFKSGKSSFLISVIIHASIGILVSLYGIGKYIETTQEVRLNLISPSPRRTQPRLPLVRQSADSIASSPIQSQGELNPKPNLNPSFKFPEVPNPMLRTSAISPKGLETSVPFRPGIAVSDSGGSGLAESTGILGRMVKLAEPIKLQKRSDPLGIAGDSEAVRASYRVVYCLDISSSMESTGPEKLRAAINAVKDSLRFLRDSDQFNIISFALKTREFSEKFLDANYENVSKSMEFLESVSSKQVVVTSNTNLASALERGALLEPDLLVLITDGRPTAGDFFPDEISQKLKATGFEGKFLVAGIDVEENSIEFQLLRMLSDSNRGELRILSSRI